MPAPTHFLTGAELDAGRLDLLLHRAAALKESPRSSRALEGRIRGAALPAAVHAHAHVVRGGRERARRPPDGPARPELQLTRGESIRDTALVFSRHVAAIGLRTGSEDELERAGRVRHRARRQHALAAAPPVPGAGRPADHARGLRVARGPRARLRRRRQQRRPLARRRGCAGGPGGACGRAGRLPAPRGRDAKRSSRTTRTRRSTGADAVYTDVWVSMSDSADSAAARREALAPYRLDADLLARAKPEAFALHCLPAHPGEEITEDVLYGDRQRIWDQAENRRHAQKALLELLVSPRRRTGRGRGGHERRRRRRERTRPRRPAAAAEPARRRGHHARPGAGRAPRRGPPRTHDPRRRHRAAERPDAPRPPPDGGHAGRPRGRPRPRRSAGPAAPPAWADPFPIADYDDLTAAQIVEQLRDLEPPELRRVRDYERRNANRKTRSARSTRAH